MKWEMVDGVYTRPLMVGEEFANDVYEVVLPEGEIYLTGNRSKVLGYYLLDGYITIFCRGRTWGKDTLLWISGGKNILAWATGAVHAIPIVSAHEQREDRPRIDSFVESELAWSRPLADAMTASRHMIRAEDWGVKIQTCIYTKGFHHTRHSHAHAHLCFVLEGMLYHEVAGDDRRLYGPGEAALAPAHTEVLHELAPGAPRVRYLFVGDGPFDFIVDGQDLYNA